MSDLEQQLAELLRSTTERTLSDEVGRAFGTATQAMAALSAPQNARLNSTASTRTASNAAQSAGSTVMNTILDGMGLSPILRGVFSLFGGGDDEPAPPLPKYLAPGSVRLTAGLMRDSASPVAIDYGQGGEAREVAPAAPQVVVNVSALDTQSFLDRSGDIAEAVKRALLESHSLNDVIAEL
jgi:hypothetical protein